jgi:hypothetical protein
MFDRVVFNYKDLEVRVSDHPNEEILDLLDHTIHGAEGGMRYSLQNVSQRIKAYGDKIRFVSLYKKNHVTGTIGSCYRISGQGNLRFPSSYLKYLSIQPTYQTELRRRRRDRLVQPSEKDQSFKHKTLDIFSKPHLLDLQDVFEGDKHIMYAFVESMNERTKNLVTQAGYEYVRSFLTMAFSRFSPKRDKRVSKIKEEEEGRVKELLNSYYKNFSLFTTDYSFYGNKYYVLRDGDEIIAGAAAFPALHKIYDIPQIWGWVIMKVLPKMPYYRRLFHPGEFRFLIFDSIYCKEGHEKSLENLFESICAAEGYYTGLTWLDDRSKLYDKIRTGVNMGALNRMLNAKPGLVYIRFINLDEKEKECFYESPAYISGFDFSL